MADNKKNNSEKKIGCDGNTSQDQWMSEKYELGLVSVIIPTHNRVKFLGGAMDSVLNQTYRPIELIVVDDGSNDNTKEFVHDWRKKYADDERFELHYFYQENHGSQVARNRGLTTAGGKYVRFLDSDDWLCSNATKAQIGMLETTPADVCYGAWLETCDGFQEARERQGVFTAELNPDPVAALLGSQWCPNFCYLMLRETAVRAGGWSEHYGAIQDRDFINRIALMGARFVGTSEEIGCYRQHGDSRISRDDKARWLRFMKRTIDDGIEWLDKNSQWTDARRHAVALALFHHARRYRGWDRAKFNECVNTIRRISPRFKAPGTFYPAVACLLGYWHTENVRRFCRRLLRGGPMKSWQSNTNS